MKDVQKKQDCIISVPEYVRKNKIFIKCFKNRKKRRNRIVLTKKYVQMEDRREVYAVCYIEKQILYCNLSFDGTIKMIIMKP